MFFRKLLPFSQIAVYHPRGSYNDNVFGGQPIYYFYKILNNSIVILFTWNLIIQKY